MTKEIITTSVLTMIATLSISLLSTVNAEERKGPRGGKPPAEALEACASMSAEESCSFSSERGDVTGTCKAPPHGEGALACVPSGGRPPKQD